MIFWFSCIAICALVFIFLLRSLKLFMTSFLWYLSGVGQKLRFWGNSLHWYFVNVNFCKLITFPEGKIWYQFVLSTVFHKNLMFPWFEEEVIGFVFFGVFYLFFWALLQAETIYAFLVSRCKLRFVCFNSLVITLKVGLVRDVAQNKISVCVWTAFCFSGESSLTSC